MLLKNSSLSVSFRSFSTLNDKSLNLRNIVKNNLHFDAVIVGAGIAGAAAALGVTTPQLASPFKLKDLSDNSDPVMDLSVGKCKRVLVIDAETDFCYHSTGRTAAVFSEVYGSPSAQILSTASKPFLYAPRALGFSPQGSLVSRRPNVWAATAESHNEMLSLFESTRRLVPNLKLLSPSEISLVSPWSMINNDHPPSKSVIVDYLENEETYKAEGLCCPTPLTGAIFEPDGADMDVHAIWRTMKEQAIQNGADFQKGVRIGDVIRRPRGDVGWEIELQQHVSGDSSASTAFSIDRKNQADSSNTIVKVTTDLVINAAGAWADVVAEKFHIEKVGLVPKKRTVILFNPLDLNSSFKYPLTGSSVDKEKYLRDQKEWPVVFDLAGKYYYKPDAGAILASPEDETPIAPCDAQPDETDIALCVHRLATLSYLNPQHIVSSWAGLRSFVEDGNFVLGFDDDKMKSIASKKENDFLWVAGLGGFGVQASYGNARAVAALVHQGNFPADMLEHGLNSSDLSPVRCRRVL
eukprot:GDKJ01030758.1.p1 GENE.GDKJ01030758.1~~GDKJ01030758.1.p1  ORF type:complete len:523 (-),score=123.87 GDKJ01030758.1:1417-2985(-)